MASQVPFYLQKENTPPKLGTIDLFDFQSTPTKNYDATSVWTDVKDNLSSASNYIYEAEKGAWISAKESAAQVYDFATTEAGKGFSFLNYQMFLMVGGIGFLIWIMGKSGGFGAVSAFFNGKGGQK